MMGVLLLVASFIICGITVTGLAGSFTAGFVSLSGGNLVLMLAIAVAVAYIFGLAGMILVPYIMLAVMFAPGFLQVADVNVLALHLLLIYYCNLSQITPPIAIAAFLGASMAGADLQKTAWQSVRLGIVLFFMPILFLFEPALILHGEVWRLIYLLPACLAGISLICAALEGYLWKVGKLNWWFRVPFVVAGSLAAFPEWKTTVIGIILAAIVIAVMWGKKKLMVTGVRLPQ